MSTAAILSAILLFASPAFAQDFVPTPVKRQVSGTPAPVQTTSPLPLTDYHYTYPNLPEQVKFVFFLKSPVFFTSRSTNGATVLSMLAVVPNPVTTSVTVPLRGPIHCVRPCLSTALMVTGVSYVSI